MKFELFKKLIDLILDENERSRKRDKEIQKALGGDSSVVMDIPIVDEILSIIIDEFPGSATTMYWFIYDVLIMDSPELSFNIDGKDYVANYENIYNLISGNID